MLQGFKGTRLDQIWNTNQRSLGVRVCIWNPKFDTMHSVVLNKWNGPRYDISHFVEASHIAQNQVFENGADAVSSRATFSIAIDTTEGITVGAKRLKVDQKMFLDGTPIVVYEGDTRIAIEDWPPVFTGVIRGYPGANTSNRARTRKIRVQAFGRAQTYQRQSIVGINFGQNSDLGDMAVETAMSELGLSREEIQFGKFDQIVLHKTNALTQIEKMSGLNEIMKHANRRPYFDSRGFLVSHDTSFFKPPAWYFREDQVVSIDRTQNIAQQVNSTEVNGLDYNLTEILQAMKKINSVDITLGYFEASYSEPIYYSDDETRRVKNSMIQIETRPGFAGESISWVPQDDFHGILTIGTGYAPQVLGLIAVIYAAAAAVEYLCDHLIDTLLLDPTGVLAWLSVPTLVSVRGYSQMAKSAALITCMVLMQKIGRFKVVIWGEPFENVYQELRAIAVMKDTSPADVVERSESYHWLSTQVQVKEMAKTLLRREMVKSHTYKIRVPSVSVLEVDDLIEINCPNHGFPRPVRFYITSIDRKFNAANKDGLMVISAWHCKEEMP